MINEKINIGILWVSLTRSFVPRYNKIGKKKIKFLCSVPNVPMTNRQGGALEIGWRGDSQDILICMGNSEINNKTLL